MSRFQSHFTEGSGEEGAGTLVRTAGAADVDPGEVYRAGKGGQSKKSQVIFTATSSSNDVEDLVGDELGGCRTTVVKGRRSLKAKGVAERRLGKKGADVSASIACAFGVVKKICRMS